MKNSSFKFKIIKIILLLAYLGCVLFLIFESALPGNISANQSNTIGGGIADIINNANGDQASKIEPTSLSIENKLTDLNVGDSYTLEIKLAPENTNYKSITYFSNNDVVSISNDGKLTALKEGEAIIKASSSKFPDINDSFTIKVHNVIEESITTYLDLDMTSSYYELENNSSYLLHTDFLPENTTFKDVTYIYSSPCININNDTLYTLKSSEEIIEIKVCSLNNKYSTIKIKIKNNTINVVNLEKIEISKNSYTIPVNGSVKINSTNFKITFTPANASYKSYKLSISDTSIVQISNTTLKGLKAGRTTLKVTSTYDETIYDEREVVVGCVEIKSMSSVTLGNLKIAKLKVNESLKIQCSNQSPSNASCLYDKENLVTYSTSSNNIKLVENTVTGLNVSKNNIVTVSFYNPVYDENGNYINREFAFSKDLIIEVYTPGKVNDFSLNIKSDSTNNNVLHETSINQQFNLKSYINISSMYDENGSTIDYNSQGISTSLTYEIVSSDPLDAMNDSLIKNNYFSTNYESSFSITFNVTHTYSNITKSVTYYFIKDYSIETSINEIEIPYSNSIDIKVNDNLKLNFTNLSSSKDDNLSFKYSLSNNECYSLLASEMDSLTIRGVDEGEIELIVKPSYSLSNIDLSEYSKTIKINIGHRLIDDFNITLIDENNTEVSLINETDNNDDIIQNSYIVNTSPKKQYQVKIDYLNNPSKYQMDISYDNDISTIENDTIQINKAGRTTYIFKEKYSNITKRITFDSRNIVKFKEQIISIDKIKSYDDDTSTYHIENGTAVTLNVNYSEDTTFKEVSYKVENENILIIGKDSKITPLEIGSTKLSIFIKDNYTIDLKIDINIQVDRKDFISNMNNFLYYIRKGIGHFGSFLITAIFSTLVYMLFVNKKLWLFSIPFNLTSGFFLATLTEFIQTFTPNRYGTINDVLLDFAGFSFGTIITILVVIILSIIIYIRSKKRQKEKVTYMNSYLMSILLDNIKL